MLAEGTPAENVTKEQAEQVIRNVEAYRTHAGLSTTKIGRAIGYGASTISQVLHWKYNGDWQEVIVDLDRWLEEQIKRDNAPRATDFVWTRVAQEIKTVADAAVTLRTIGLVYGPTTSGIGKTMALEAIAAEKAGSIMITIEKVAANPSGLLRAIAAELRLSQGNPSNAWTFARIKDVLKDTPRLLIIDQIHNLCGGKDDKAFFILADLHDATGAPQLWCGTSDIVAYLDSGQAKGKETQAQIRRRIGISRDLMDRTREGGGAGGHGEPLYSIDEIRRVFGRNKMRLAPDAASYLCRLANLPDSGALGACKNLVVMATTVHAKSGATILTADMLRAVHPLLVNRRAFELLESRLKLDERRPLAKAG